MREQSSSLDIANTTVAAWVDLWVLTRLSFMLIHKRDFTRTMDFTRLRRLTTFSIANHRFLHEPITTIQSAKVLQDDALEILKDQPIVIKPRLLLDLERIFLLFSHLYEIVAKLVIKMKNYFPMKKIFPQKYFRGEQLFILEGMQDETFWFEYNRVKVIWISFSYKKTWCKLFGRISLDYQQFSY